MFYPQAPQPVQVASGASSDTDVIKYLIQQNKALTSSRPIQGQVVNNRYVPSGFRNFNPSYVSPNYKGKNPIPQLVRSQSLTNLSVSAPLNGAKNNNNNNKKTNNGPKNNNNKKQAKKGAVIDTRNINRDTGFVDVAGFVSGEKFLCKDHFQVEDSSGKSPTTYHYYLLVTGKQNLPRSTFAAHLAKISEVTRDLPTASATFPLKQPKDIVSAVYIVGYKKPQVERKPLTEEQRQKQIEKARRRLERITNLQPVAAGSTASEQATETATFD